MTDNYITEKRLHFTCVFDNMLLVGGVVMANDEIIEELREELIKLIEDGASYEEILKKSQELDKYLKF